MNNRLIIRPRAEIQIEEAYHWYEKQQKNLGDDFLFSVEDSLQVILLNPQAFQIKYKHVRAIYIKRFPFGIFFIVDKENITVVAVFHLSRNPKLWKKLKR